MSDIKKGFYEFLIRWNCEVGEKFGNIRGIQKIERKYVVEKGNIVGKVDSGPEDHAVTSDLKELRKVVGDQIVDIMDQMNTLGQGIREVKEERDELQGIINSLKAEVQSRDQMIERNNVLLQDYRNKVLEYQKEIERLVNELKSHQEEENPEKPV